MENCELVYLADNFVSLKVGEAIRLLPFGDLVKSGTRRKVTKALASQFKLPHFKPPIKLGSHDDETRAGGFIRALDVRSDGLYGIPEYTEEGAQSIERGDYRYYSPEIIWEGGGIENPETGEIISGPIVVGLALLHTPHLGERAALYNFESQEVEPMTEHVQVDKNVWDSIVSVFKPQVEQPKPEPETPAISADEFDALKVERDDLKAQIEQLESAKKVEQLKTEVRAELRKEERFGTLFIELEDAQEAVDVLAGMSEEQRAWVMTKFSAFIAQINDAALLAEAGSDGGLNLDDDPLTKLDRLALKVMDERKIEYNEAREIVAKENPGLVKEAYG